MGCMGIIYSVIIQVRPKFSLKEEREIIHLSKITHDFLNKCINDNEHVEIYISPYTTRDSNEHPALLTRRNETNEPHVNTEKGRHFMTALSKLLGPAENRLGALISLKPHDVPVSLYKALSIMEGTFIDKSYKIFNLGDSSGYLGYAIEFGFPITVNDDGSYNFSLLFAGIAEIIQLANAEISLSNQYFSSPFSLRFVKESEAHMSMMQGAPLTAMIEMDMASGSYGGISILHRIGDKMLHKFGPRLRMHWGLNLDGFPATYIRKSYPNFNLWYDVYQQFNREGTFNNKWTCWMELDQHPAPKDVKTSDDIPFTPAKLRDSIK